MDVFTQTELEQLTSGDNMEPCVSVYLPTHVTGPEAPQDAIRLKNLLRTAESKLSDNWMRAPEARDMLRRASALPTQDDFWTNRDLGLAVFLTRDQMWAYRLPIAFPESLTVSRRFRVRRLLPMLDQQRRFYVLALSQNDCGLYSATPLSIQRLEVVDLPRNMEQALNLDQSDRGAQVHSAATGVFGKQAGVFHGQGGKPDRAKSDLESFLKQVNKAVVQRLADAADPLVLAAVNNVSAAYRKVNSYAHLLEPSVSGNHEMKKPKRLLEIALPIAQTHWDHERGQAATRFQEAVHSERTADDIRLVLDAAASGRIDVLFHNPAASLFGSYRLEARDVVITGDIDDDDLVDVAVVETIRHRGKVFPMTDQDLSTNSAVAAVMRY